MKRFLNWFGRTFESNRASANRPRTFRPQLEQLDQRLLPSLSSAISIQHSGWTERDWYTVAQNRDIAEFHGTMRHRLAYLADPQAVSASVDSNTGYGEVFAIDHEQPTVQSHRYYLFLCDSYDNWHYLQDFGVSPVAISATRDGHVYVESSGAVYYVDSNGNVASLGYPNPGVRSVQGPADPDPVAASVGWFGQNEVFVIGKDGAIYVNSSNTPGDWQLVDNSAQFVSLSATPNDTVFAVTTTGNLYQETEHVAHWGWLRYWSGQDISGGMFFNGKISADTDASGRDEVYAVVLNNYSAYLANAYVYHQGSWTWKDADVYDISGAGGGYFYDVDYNSGRYSAYFCEPTAGWWGNWTWLGDGLR